MKTLYIIRHANSKSNNLEQNDFERTLDKVGLKEATFMAQKLKELDVAPDYIICSPSIRTTTTLELLCPEINYPLREVLFDQSIYEATLPILISIINSLPNTKNEIALIGHNPSITGLANYLTDNYISCMTTCCIIKIELEIDNWNEIIAGIGIQKFFIHPQEIH